jgi:DNA repair photolyase
MSIELFTPGCLGTCWCGKYHYFEPWVGCEHDCDYCYARFRSDVTSSLATYQTSFDKPVQLLKTDALLASIKTEISRQNIKLVKASRYTDLFTPSMVATGLSREILRELINSSAERIIITTKGLPDRESLELMKANVEKISYNPVAKPTQLNLEKTSGTEHRLLAAAELQRSGVQVTVHMDPLIPGIDDEEQLLTGFLNELKTHELNRVMFSFLLLNDDIIKTLRARQSDTTTDSILANYNIEKTRQILPKQAETAIISARQEISQKATMTLSTLLRANGFDFVKCGLKNQASGIDKSTCPPCDGSFYA